MSWFKRGRHAASENWHGWEGHPCTMPEDLGLPHLNNVWRCPCGRRWQLISITNEVRVAGLTPVYRWRELVPDYQPEFRVTDEMIEEFLDNPDAA